MNNLWAALQTASLTLMLASVGATQDIELAIENIENPTAFERNRASLILPGTKWCGMGNKSKSYDDLGTFSQTDKCCRDHDHCPDYIEAGDTEHGLKNAAFFTRLHCDCETQFYDCLKSCKSFVATKVGFAYFNVYGPKCFRLEFPVTGCANKSGFPLYRCKQYNTDTSQEKKWQWFDNLVFTVFSKK